MQKGTLDDRLSNLPDDILLAILDRLDVRDAARASVFSRRWRQLPAMLSRLQIDVRDFLNRQDRTCYAKEAARSNATIAEVTKSLLLRRELTGNTIYRLCITFFLREKDHISIGCAVDRAMVTQKVEIVEFDVLTETRYMLFDEEHLVRYGRQFTAFFDACPDAFGGLTRLRLEYLRFGELDIANILVTCKRLKHLRLFRCDSGDCTMLQVEHAQLYPLSLGHVPLLEAVRFINVGLSGHEAVKLSKFLGDTSVRDRLGFESEKIWVQPERPTKGLASVFHKLRSVTLTEIPEECDLMWTLFILEASPNLKELCLTVWTHACKMVTDKEERRELGYSEEKGVEWDEPSDFQHHNLVTLTIFGFQALVAVHYVRRVMKVAMNLHDVFLYRRMLCPKCKASPPFYPCTELEGQLWKKWITNGMDTLATIHFPSCKAMGAAYPAKLQFP
ncbi:hypothetical protein BRADI_3g06101v3 [Brachypodium distachyon]|uniref:F-box domain-containing protein n=1 Tax=Brachypodium distachyon TaxID=15368 RepID=A0A2K2CVJ2_BRADI|nr:hypothetical protein BRADI_3g06101v3 [Brachypodium distachyon]